MSLKEVKVYRDKEGVLSYGKSVRSMEIREKIRSLYQEMDEYEEELRFIRGDIDTLEDELGRLENLPVINVDS